MPRHWAWTEEAMLLALDELHQGSAVSHTSEKYGIPPSTLTDRFKKKKKTSPEQRKWILPSKVAREKKKILAQIPLSRKSKKYSKYSEETMQEAVKEVRQGGIPAHVAIKYGIPASTLSDRLSGRRLSFAERHAMRRARYLLGASTQNSLSSLPSCSSTKSDSSQGEVNVTPKTETCVTPETPATAATTATAATCSSDWAEQDIDNQDLMVAVKSFTNFSDRYLLLSGDPLATRPHVCPTCKLTFALERTLETHQMLEHKQEPKHTCFECGMQFLSRESFDFHDQSRHRENVQSETVEHESVTLNTRSRRSRNTQRDTKIIYQEDEEEAGCHDSPTSHTKSHRSKNSQRDTANHTKIIYQEDEEEGGSHDSPTSHTKSRRSKNSQRDTANHTKIVYQEDEEEGGSYDSPTSHTKSRRSKNSQRDTANHTKIVYQEEEEEDDSITSHTKSRRSKNSQRDTGCHTKIIYQEEEDDSITSHTKSRRSKNSQRDTANHTKIIYQEEDDSVTSHTKSRRSKNSQRDTSSHTKIIYQEDEEADCHDTITSHSKSRHGKIQQKDKRHHTTIVYQAEESYDSKQSRNSWDEDLPVYMDVDYVANSPENIGSEVEDEIDGGEKESTDEIGMLSSSQTVEQFTGPVIKIEQGLFSSAQDLISSLEAPINGRIKVSNSSNSCVSGENYPSTFASDYILAISDTNSAEVLSQIDLGAEVLGQNGMSGAVLEQNEFSTDILKQIDMSADVPEQNDFSTDGLTNDFSTDGAKQNVFSSPMKAPSVDDPTFKAFAATKTAVELLPFAQKGSKERFKCPLCHIERQHMCKLKSHLYQHTGEKHYRCNKCSQAFSTASKRSMHMRSRHSSDSELRQHMCGVCGNKYRSRQMAEYHEMQVHGEKNLLCPHCPYRTAVKWALKIHMRQHSGEKPCVCEHCGECFTVSVSLRTHLKSKHGIVVDTSMWHRPQVDPDDSGVPKLGRPKKS